jgi:hypothetical protein
LAQGAGDHLALPLNEKSCCVAAGTGTGLPTGVGGHGAKERDCLRLLAFD